MVFEVKYFQYTLFVLILLLLRKLVVAVSISCAMRPEDKTRPRTSAGSLESLKSDLRSDLHPPKSLPDSISTALVFSLLIPTTACTIKVYVSPNRT